MGATTVLTEDTTLTTDIAALKPDRIIDETPLGRLTAIWTETWCIYSRIHQLLAETANGNLADREEELRDLAETLYDLHRREAQSYSYCTRVSKPLRFDAL